MSSFPLTAYADAQFRLIRDDRRWMRSNLILTYTIRTQIKGTEPQHYRAVVKETEILLQFEICSRTNKPFWSRDISIIFTFTLSHEPTLSEGRNHVHCFKNTLCSMETVLPGAVLMAVALNWQGGSWIWTCTHNFFLCIVHSLGKKKKDVS